MKKSAFGLILAVIVFAAMMSVTALSSPAQILGDVDRDNALTSADVRIVMQYMVGNRTITAEQFLLADCDGNKRVDTLDMRYVLQVITLDLAPSTLPTTTTTTTTPPTTTTTKPSLDDDGYYDDVVRP